MATTLYYAGVNGGGWLDEMMHRHSSSFDNGKANHYSAQSEISSHDVISGRVLLCIDLEQQEGRQNRWLSQLRLFKSDSHLFELATVVYSNMFL